jgi:hypothetical protein
MEISDGRRIDFKVYFIELISRNNTTKLIQATLLLGLTSGLNKLVTLPLHIDDYDGKIHCKFGKTSTIIPPQPITTIKRVDCYITSDLAFQAQRSEKVRDNFTVNSNFAAFGLNSNSANLGLL